MFRVGFREEGALVVVEPPRQSLARQILEIHNDVLIAVKKLLVEELTGAVNESAVTKLRLRVDALSVKAREDSCRAGTVETLIVEANTHRHRVIKGRTPLRKEPSIHKLLKLRWQLGIVKRKPDVQS